MITTAPRRTPHGNRFDEELRNIMRPGVIVIQMYLLDNPLLREPLTIDHIKPGCPATGARRRA